MGWHTMRVGAAPAGALARRVRWRGLLACAVLLAAAPAAAQPTPPSREEFVNAALARLESSRSAAEQRLAVAVATRQGIETELSVARQARAVAAGEHQQREREEAQALERWRSRPQAQWEDQTGRQLQAAQVRTRAAEAALRQAVEHEMQLAQRLESARAAETSLAAGAQRALEARAGERRRLEPLRQTWLRDPSDVTWSALAHQITQAARTTGVESRVTWRTSPRPGATLYYQTMDDRERRATPFSVSSPTETVQSIPIGYYYVWAERGGVPTSNRNRLFRIVAESEVLTIGENISH